MSKRRKAGASAFGLALVAMLVFAAFGASAAGASTWHVEGNSFSGEEGVSWSGGPVSIANQSLGFTISCGSVSGTTEIKESSKSTGTITLGSCAVANMPQCKAQPLNLNFNGYLVDSGGQAYERYNVSGKWTINGTGCYSFESPQIEGSIAAAIGIPDAVNSPRVFSAAAESATGASGLHFAGSWQWKASGEAKASLSGKNAGKDFGTGVGGTWKPAPASWTVGGKAFSGTEEIAWSEAPTSIEIEKTNGSLTIRCKGLVNLESGISSANRSASAVVLYGCAIATAPKCTVSDSELSLSGQIGGVEGGIFEKVDLRGTVEMSGIGCPFTGVREIGGSVGAYLESHGTSISKWFIGELVDPVVKGTDLRLNGESWYFNAEELQASLSGASKGKAFGVQ